MGRPALPKALVVLGYLVALFVCILVAMIGITLVIRWDGASSGTVELVRVGFAFAVSASVFHTLARERARSNDAPETQFG